MAFTDTKLTIKNKKGLRKDLFKIKLRREITLSKA